jgi:hypothetical protein
MPPKHEQPKANYEIPVDLIKVSRDEYEVVPNMPTDTMELGKTVHYKLGKFEYHESDAGRNGSVVNVKFEVSPFVKTEVSSDDPPLELKVPGHFTGHCSIKTSDGEEYGWGIAGSRISGGDMIVR